jgi:FAD/FMN-containing dehydrogenase
LLPASADENAIERVSQAATEMIHQGTSLGGRAVIEWAPTTVKRRVSVWGPVREDLTLMQGLKGAFDPDRVLSPGRFLGRI